MPRLEATQANRPLAIVTPLGEDVLLFHSMSASEQLGRLFQYDLELLSSDPEIKLEDILGQNVTVRYQRTDGQLRYFNGFISEFGQQGTHGDLFVYQATVRPWLWFLTRTADCRIFQEKTVPDIIKEVFRVHGFSDFEEALSGHYRQWEYCVQYRETDFGFVCRLMEQEGIYYYFKHENGKHTMVLSDSISAHETVPGYEEVPYYPPQQAERRERDHISEWSLKQAIQTGVFALNDFDFKKPKANLQVKSSVARQHEQAELEIYDYPGEYLETDEGESYARARIEELQAQYEQVKGQGNAGGLITGGLFKLTNYARVDQNREYLITSANYRLGPQEYEGASLGGEGPVFLCRFSAIDKQQSFRTPRMTPKPIVQGPQTAIVVGPAGEEIWTDEYGRVKVQFHWDRYGAADEKSSCWIRVSHPWAGKNWGAVALPRIGQEVIVNFLEGDPDRPIITGRVYNNDNMPPYELPANKTQSGIKSRSSKSGVPDNFNEIRFEDKKGEEQLYIHAEKNQDNIVENDETTAVGHDRTEDVGNDETITIGNNRTENVGKNESISIGQNRSESVGKNESVNIAENRDKSVGKSESITIGEDLTEDVGKNMTLSVGDDQKISIGKNLSIVVGKKTVIEAGDSLTLNCGKASIILKKDGKVQITGKDINIKASGNIKLKGSKIAQN